MKKLNQVFPLLLAGAAFALTVMPANLLAQDAPPPAPTLPTAPTDSGTGSNAPAASTDQGQGQGGQNRRRNFDPAQMQQRHHGTLQGSP